MNKNLKKVISAVAALAISASSFTALAAGFPDVDKTASYAQAVQELSALDIISGYEDNTFRPENLVTRAEITKMIVDALNLRRVADSAKSVATTFADVAAGENGHWANGYIATGVNRGFISGHSEVQFSPDDNVTYVQAQKMLVAALGYDSYAQKAGGWPSGYTAYANQKGITNGVNAMSDDALTRAQVAQMIDNAMDVPVVAMTGMQQTILGDQPSYDVMDGTGKGYETLFTRMNTYKVYGRVTATARTNAALDNDMVSFQVEKTDRFKDAEVKADDPVEEEMYFGDTNAEELIRTYAQALIKVDDDDECTILSIVPAAANKTVSLLAANIDENRSNVDNKVLYFYPEGKTSGSVKYPLAANVDFYLNGVKQDGYFSNADLTNYIVNNETAMVTLQKETAIGSTSTSSDYNVIMITACGTAVVETVADKTTTTTISFKAQSNGLRSRMTIQKDDENYRYSFKLDGEEIAPTDLEENDVLTIAYDTDDFSTSSFYDVIVTRGSVEDNAKYMGVSSDRKDYSFSTGKYSLAIAQAFATSTEYTLYFDANGRVAYADEVANSKKIGIVKSYYTERDEDNTVEIITKEGSVAKFTVESAQAWTDAKGVVDAAKAANAGDLAGQYSASVVEYKSTSAGKLTAVTPLAWDTDASKANGDMYKESTNKIGSIRLSDVSVLIDLSNVNNDKTDIKVVSSDSLKDGVYYDAYGYDKSNGICRFVIITDGAGGIDAYSEMAIFLDAQSNSDEDGQDLVEIILADTDSDDGTKVLTLDENVSVVTPVVTAAAAGVLSTVADVKALLAEGDAIVYSTNTEGKVDEIAIVFDSVNAIPSAKSDTFADFFAAYIGKNAPSILNSNVADWMDVLDENEEEDAEIIAGVLLNIGNGYAIATEVDEDVDGMFVGASKATGAIDLDISSKTKIYAYNYNNNTKNHARIIVDNGMTATPYRPDAFAANNASKYYIQKTDTEAKGQIDMDEVVYAVARVHNGDEVQEIYLIVAE